jgi:endonuclease-3 related protein
VTSAERLMAIFHGLDRMHGWRQWHWDPDSDPFEVAVGAILVQNTQWTNAEAATERLKAAGALNVPAMSSIETEALAELIRPSGQFRQKAKKLRAFLDLIEAHGSFPALLALPADDLRAKLVATWGIGEETADAIIAYAAHQPAFVIDAYTRRLFARLGVGPVESTAYTTWQRFFTSTLPVDGELWGRFHSLIVLHCKYLCRKSAPVCGECALSGSCPASSVRVSVPAAPG